MPNLEEWKEKAWSSTRKVETKAWRALDPIGRWGNRQAGRFGIEAFYPMSLPEEIAKCARTISAFTELDEMEKKRAEAEYAEKHGTRHPAAQQQPQAAEPGAVPEKVESGTAATADTPANAGAHGAEGAPAGGGHPTQQKMLATVSPKVLQKAKGVAIFTVLRTGWGGFSGSGGSGVVISRNENGEWGAPSGILVHTLGFGFVFGADIYDVVLVLRNEQAVNAFKNPKISLGGELSVAAGPIGTGSMVDSGIEAAPCFSYIKSKGFYAGVQLDGTIVLSRIDEDARFYHYPDIKVETLLDNTLPRHQIPAEVMPLWQALYRAEGRPDYMGTDQIPQGEAPSDHVLTDAEVDQLHAEGMRRKEAEQGGESLDEKPLDEKPAGLSGDDRHVPPPPPGDEKPSEVPPPVPPRP